ncbi:citryl-CoA lyase [Actinomadura opuntiae]|uniref:citryl-CoA lyase n=1 Tax=Actinomadura sp. OS1-43 TaxID=604315 RepID=UPI00255A871D|nr:citryl-CoA lyase [Actinomadura sp. OS1-43]MDL4814324.1 citryl-CoA lyase [Actinomadura sp. OS1-43]
MNDIDPTGTVAQWWATAISRMEPGVIELRGRPVQDLIGTTGLSSMIWLMLRGDLPTARQAALLEAALVAAVDHGPQAPSIAIARMAATCGVGLNNAVASAVNTLGDAHGGAGEQCVQLLDDVLRREAGGLDLRTATEQTIADWPRYLPGFGHRFHPRDPRRDPLLALVEDAVRDGVVPGDHLRAGKSVEALLAEGRDKPVPMNIDGATAIIYAELGFPAPLARGLFVLSRSIGILAHAWEETQSGQRNKGPIPRAVLPAYRP